MISRRATLHMMVSLVPSLLLPGSVTAQQKASQQSVQYQEQPKGDQKCSGCKFFVEPKGCQVVDGEISPEGWCLLFQVKG